MHDTFPVVRLTVHGMEHAIQVAIDKDLQKIDCDLKQAVAAFCTPENIRSIIDAEVARVVKYSIAQAVESYYRYGVGRKKIAEIALKELGQKASLETIE